MFTQVFACLLIRKSKYDNHLHFRSLRCLLPPPSKLKPHPKHELKMLTSAYNTNIQGDCGMQAEIMQIMHSLEIVPK